MKIYFLYMILFLSIWIPLFYFPFPRVRKKMCIIIASFFLIFIVILWAMFTPPLAARSVIVLRRMQQDRSHRFHLMEVGLILMSHRSLTSSSSSLVSFLTMSSVNLCWLRDVDIPSIHDRAHKNLTHMRLCTHKILQTFHKLDFAHSRTCTHEFLQTWHLS